LLGVDVDQGRESAPITNARDDPVIRDRLSRHRSLKKRRGLAAAPFAFLTMTRLLEQLHRVLQCLQYAPCQWDADEAPGKDELQGVRALIFVRHGFLP
jgi:hypothetical protein